MDKFNLITNSLVDLGDDLEVEGNGKGRKFVSKFIEPGVASYEQFGDVLITKETLNKFINTMVGCPVIIKHKDITDENADKERVGVVSDVWFNEQDGWFYCSGIIWDKQAIDLVKNQGWNVSCTYDFESDKQEKTHNGKKIDMEFIDGEFLHLALVNNPRYERANIVMNSKAENADHWITVHPNGKDEKGQPLLVKDGETNKEAIERKFGDNGQLALGFKGAKKAQRESRDYENKKATSEDKLYKIQAADEVKDYGKKLVEALEEYNKYHENKLDLDSIEEFVYDYEEKEQKEKGKRAYKNYVKEQTLKQQPKDDKKEDKITKEIKSLVEEEIKSDEKFGLTKEKRSDYYKDDDAYTSAKLMQSYRRLSPEAKTYVADKAQKILDSQKSGKYGHSQKKLNKALEEVLLNFLKKDDKASNALLNGLETILDDLTPDKADLPVLNGLKDILEQ